MVDAAKGSSKIRLGAEGTPRCCRALSVPSLPLRAPQVGGEAHRQALQAWKQNHSVDGVPGLKLGEVRSTLALLISEETTRRPEHPLSEPDVRILQNELG